MVQPLNAGQPSRNTRQARQEVGAALPLIAESDEGPDGDEDGDEHGGVTELDALSTVLYDSYTAPDVSSICKYIHGVSNGTESSWDQLAYLTCIDALAATIDHSSE